MGGNPRRKGSLDPNRDARQRNQGPKGKTQLTAAPAGESSWFREGLLKKRRASSPLQARAGRSPRGRGAGETQKYTGEEDSREKEKGGKPEVRSGEERTTSAIIFLREAGCEVGLFEKSNKGSKGLELTCKWPMGGAIRLKERGRVERTWGLKT